MNWHVTPVKRSGTSLNWVSYREPSLWLSWQTGQVLQYLLDHQCSTATTHRNEALNLHRLHLLVGIPQYFCGSSKFLVFWPVACKTNFAWQEMYDLDLAQFDKIAVTLDKFKIGVEGASGVWVDAGTGIQHQGSHRSGPLQQSVQNIG